MEPKEINIPEELDKELEDEILYEALEEELNTLENEDTDSQEEEPPKKIKRKKRKFKLKNALQIKSVLMLIILLLSNTYAWFIYISRVDATLSVQVREWKFELESGGQAEQFEFVVDDIYPGINTDDTIKEIEARNSSPSAVAIFSCDLYYLKIFDTEYRAGDGQPFTSEDLINMIANEYPFKIQILLIKTLDDGTEEIEPYDPTAVYEMVPNSQMKIRVQIVWPYESTSDTLTLEELDELDTIYGNLAYEYHTDPAHQDEYSIVVKMNIKAEQKNETP